MTDDVQGLGAKPAAYVPRIVDAQIDKPDFPTLP